MAKDAVAIDSSCAHLPWISDVMSLRVCASTAFHTLLTHGQVVSTILTPLASRSCGRTGGFGGEAARRRAGRGRRGDLHLGEAGAEGREDYDVTLLDVGEVLLTVLEADEVVLTLGLWMISLVM